MAYLPALLIAGAALLVLVLMLVAIVGPVRRFRTEVGRYRARLDAEASQLQAAREEVRSQLGNLRAGPSGGYDRRAGETEEHNG